MVDAFWKTGQFAQLLNAVREQRAKQSAINNYASTFTQAVNKSKAEKPPIDPTKKALFDWGQRTYGVKIPTQTVDPALRLDDRKQALLHNQSFADKRAIDSIEQARIKAWQKDQTFQSKQVKKDVALGKIEKPAGQTFEEWNQARLEEENALAASIKFDPELKPGDKLYLDYKQNVVTNKPTELELFKYMGVYIPVERTSAGTLRYPEGYEGIVIDMTKLQDATFTPEVDIFLRGLESKYETVKPPTFASNIQPTGTPAYLNVLTNEITNDPTQIPLYWDQDTKQLTQFEETYKGEKNNPIILNQETLDSLGTGLQEAMQVYIANEQNADWGVGSNPAAVSMVAPIVTRENVLDGVSIKFPSTTNQQETQTVYLDPFTNQPTFLEKYPEKPEFIRNLPDPLSNGLVSNIFSAAWWEIMWGGNVTKQLMNTPTSKFMSKPILGTVSLNTVMAGAGVGFTLLYNIPTTLVRQAVWTLFGVESWTPFKGGDEWVGKKSMGDSWANFQDKLNVLRNSYNIDRATSIGKNETKTNQIDEARATTQSISEELVKWRSGTVEGWDKLSDQQKVTRIEDLETQWERALEYEATLNKLQAESIGKFTEQAGYSAQYYQAGNIPVATAELAYGYEKLYEGADWNLGKQYVGMMDTKQLDFWRSGQIPAVQQPFIMGLAGMAESEISAFERFINSGYLSSNVLSNIDDETKAFMQRTQTTTVLGVNMLFLQDVAKKSIETGVTMTTAEQYDYLVDEWLPKYLYNSATNPDRLQNTYYNTNQQLTADMANTMFQQLQVSNNYAAMASQYEEGSPEQQEVLNNAKTWMDEAMRLGDRVIEYHSRSGTLNPYAAWTYNLSEEKKNEFRTNVVEAMFQAGRLLSMEEITQISYITQDPALEMLGEIFLDVNNIALPVVAGLSKWLVKGIGREAMKVPFIGKSATKISQNTIVKTLLDRSVQTVASKQGKAATNIFLSVAQTKPATKSEFIKQVTNIAAWAKQANAVTDELTEGAVKLLKETPFRGVAPSISAQESLIQLAKTIDPDDWARIADKAWEATHEFYVKGVTKQILSQNPGKLISDPVIANNISDAVERLVASYRGMSRLGQEFGEEFRQTSLRGNLVKLGSNLVPKDTVYGAIAKKYGTTKTGQLLGGIAEVQSRFMKAWIWATLARRPAWAIFNFVDNTFRYTMASIRYGSQFGEDMKAMLKMYGDTEGVAKTIKQGQHTVKAEVESSGLMSLTDDAFTKAASMGIDKNMLSQNPLSFLSYYKSFVQINGTGKNLLGKVLGTFTAFPASIKALNNSIEMGMKTMMYIRFYEKNLAKMNHLFLTDVISHLSEVVQAKGLSPIEADMIQKHVLNSINSSGGNAAKLYDLLKHNRVDPKLSGYNIYIPESLRNAEWFDEAAQRAFLYDVTTRFQKFQARLAKSNVKEILPEHLDQFFDETLNVLQAESNMIVQGLNRDFSIITGVEIGSNGEQAKAARYSKSIEKEIKGVNEETADFLKNLDDSKPFDRKTKGKIKKYLQDNDIKFEDTDEGLKDGLAKLRAKRDEYPDSQPHTATPEELKAIDENKEGVLTNSEELTAWDTAVHSTDDSIADKWSERALWESKTHDAIAQIEKTTGFGGLSTVQQTQLGRVAKGIVDRTNNISSRVNKFFREVYPGPGIVSSKARWADYNARVINQLDYRIGHLNAEVLVPLQNGTFKATADVNMEDILQLSGIELFYDTDGIITSFRAVNPITGKQELVQNSVFVNQLKRRLGINTKADARRGLVEDYAKIVEKQAPVAEMERVNLAYSLKIPEVRPLETMVADDVRLDLAIREGRNQDAAVLLAEKFQFPMMYEKGGQLLPNYQHLLNKAKKELGLKGDDAIKTLNDIKPEDLYKVLKNWYETTTGITLASIKGNLKEGMVKAISSIFNTPTNIAEGIFETYNRLAVTIGKHMGGKSEAEVWQEILYGVMKGGDSGAVDVVRATDTLFWFNTEVRNYVVSKVGNGKIVKGVKRPITKAELLKDLKRAFNTERLESSGVLELLVGKGKVTREQIIKALDDNERFIVSVPRGKTKEWQINILDYNQSNKANITADLVSEELADGNIAIGLKVKSMAGDLDERSKQRLLRWAAENQYSFIEFSPSQIERFPTINVSGVFAKGEYGVTSFIKAELDKQQAIIRGFTNANPTTAMEELFHAFEPFLPSEHYKVLDEWAGKIAKKQLKANPNIGLSFDNLKSEIMAKGFQKHVITGRGVPKDIAEIFDTIRNTMLAIYRKMKDWFAGIELTPEVEQTFNKMLDADYVAERVSKVPKPKRPKPDPKGKLFQQVGTPEFENWFTWDWVNKKQGNTVSWVSTKDGTPIIVKTAMSDIFDEFQMDFMNTASKYGRLPYFTESATEAHSYFLRNGERGAVEDFYLSIQNPWDMDELVPWARIDEINSVLERNGYRKITFARDMYGKDAYNEFVSILDGSGLAAPKDELNKLLKKAGYDGITFMHGSLNGTTPHRVWAIFDYAQGKSLKNSGEWSVGNNKFLFQKVGGTKDSYLDDLFRQLDDMNKAVSRADTILDDLNDLVKIIDSSFYDADTGLSKVPVNLDRVVVSFSPASFDYIQKTFGVEESKRYVQQARDMLLELVNRDELYHVSPGQFVTSFATKKNADEFISKLKELQKKAVKISDSERDWVVYPTFIAGVGEDLKSSMDDLMRLFSLDRDELYSTWKLRNTVDTDELVDIAVRNNEKDLYPNILRQEAAGYDPEMQDEAWRAFVQSPIFDYGENKVSLQDMWLAFYESEEKLYKAGAEGFSAYAARVAQQLEDAGSLPMAEVFKELSEMTKNFDNFILNKISRLDPLFPTDALTGSPIPLWKTSEAMREWVSNKFMVGSQWYQQDKAIKLWKSTAKGGKEVTEWGRAGMTLDEWRNYQKGNLGSLMNQTEITTPVRETLDDVAAYTFQSKNQMDDVANYGGEYRGVQIEKNAGAVKRTNSIMMDYSDNSVLLQALKSVFPFISYPAKSVGYWMDLMTSHPELIAFYYKYQHFTDATAVQNGAVSSNGEVLPSLEGYMPLMDGLWFNPLAPLFYRFAFPRMANIRETDPEMTPSQHVAKFLLDDAPVLGFNVGPIPAQILMMMSGYETYYPKPTLVSEVVRTVFPIDFLPPVFERWMVGNLRKTFVGGIFGKDFLFPEDTLLPRVNWADYLIEKQLLTDALMRMDAMDDPKEKLDYAKTIKGILGNPNREEDQMWIDSRNKMETDQYYRTMMGHMTGLYTKDFSDGQLRLQEVRDEINVLKASIENQTLANLFGLSGDAEQRYEDYKQYKFETPEGYFWSAIQLSRYVVDPETEQQLVGQERRDEMARQYNIEEQTSMFFTAIKEAKQRYEEKMSLISIGDKESKNKLYQEYQLELAAINDNPDYAMANTESFLGYKPNSRIYKDLVDRFWYQIIATKPSMIEGEEYEVYVDRVDEWKKEISSISSVTVPILELSIINKIMESGVKIEERMKEVPVWMAQIKQQATAEGFDTWEKNKDTIVDAHWKYWEQVIFQPYMDGLKGLNMYDSQLYKMNWEAGYREPTKEEVIAWIQKEYGKTKFTKDEIAAEVGNVGYIKPEDRLVSGKNEIEKSIGDVYEIIASAGPSVGEDYKNFMKAFKSLGGTDEEWDRFYYAGDNIELWKDVDEYTEFLRKVKLAALKAEIPPASKERLEEFSQVRGENDQFRLDVEKQLGNDVWDLMGEYYDLSTAERSVYRKENPDEYYRISQYYTLKDLYATEHPLWASYYHPDFDGTLGSTSSGSTGGNYSGSGGYSSSSKGYSSSYYEYKRSPLADAFLPMGKRSRQTGMDLVVYGMGKGGVTKAPWWPQELLEKLHPAAVQQIQTGQITQAGYDYLNSVAESAPEYSKVIRDNLKLLGFGTEARKNLPTME